MRGVTPPARAGFTSSSTYYGDLVYQWTLPSGYTCPGASACLAFRNPRTRKVKAGPRREFRCYAVEAERFPAVLDKAWANLRTARIVYSTADAERLGLPVDTMDELARAPGGDFALLENFTTAHARGRGAAPTLPGFEAAI